MVHLRNYHSLGTGTFRYCNSKLHCTGVISVVFTGETLGVKFGVQGHLECGLERHQRRHPWHCSWRLQGSNFQFCTQGIVIYIFSTNQKSKFFSLLMKILSLRSWSDQGTLHVSFHGKAFF